MRVLRVTILGVAALALAGLGTSAWAAESTTSGSREASTPAAVVATSSPADNPVTKPLLVDAKVVKAGQSVSLSGAGCNPGTQVFLDLGPADSRKRQLGIVTANGAGGFKANVQIPADFPAGTTALWAACKAPNPTGKEVSTATIAITR
jgi:hypothetical protein